MDVLLVVILAVLCGVVGLLGLTLLGQVILSALGVKKDRYFAWKAAALVFGLPATAIGVWIGIQQGMELITPPPKTDRPVYVPPTQPADMGWPTTSPAVPATSLPTTPTSRPVSRESE